MTVPPVYCLLTTYQRTETALRTIRGVKQYFQWPNIGFVIVDDGSSDDHRHALTSEIGSTYHTWVYNGQRQGVGHNMNVGFRYIWEQGSFLTLLLEDDWELREPFDAMPYVKLLWNHSDIGMIRFGYLSAGIKATLESRENLLWWVFQHNPHYQYNFAGHAQLQHKRFWDALGAYKEGLAPGATELYRCSQYNTTKDAPKIVWPAEWGIWGKWHHIGSDSLADTEPGK